MKPLFRIVRDANLAIPVLAVDADGSPRVIDGEFFFSVEQAAAITGKSESELATLWEKTIADQAGVQEEEVVVDAETGEARPLVFEDLSDEDILIRARRRQRGDFSVDDWAEFTTLAKAMGYNLDAREVYPRRIRHPDTGLPSLVLVTKIEAMERRVLPSGTYDGMEGPFFCGDDGTYTDTWTSREAPTMCKVIFHRKGVSKPHAVITSLREFTEFRDENDKPIPKDRFWDVKVLLMLGKCTRARGFRELWRDIVGNVYLPDELPSSPAPRQGSTPSGPKPVQYAPDAEVGSEPAEVHTEKDCRRELARIGVPTAQQDKLISDHRQLFAWQEDENPSEFFGSIVGKAIHAQRRRRRAY